MKKAMVWLLAFMMALSSAGCAASESAAPAGDNPSGSGQEAGQEKEEEIKEDESQAAEDAEVITEAVYPEMLPFPIMEDYEDMEAYEKDYTAWFESKKALDPGLSGLPEELRDFFEKSTIQILSGCRENRNYSPMSLYMALSMLAEAAEGDTRAQLLEVLGSSDMDSLREMSRNLWLANYSDDGMTESILSNSLWTRNDMEYRQEAVDFLTGDHFASVFRGKMGSEAYDLMLQKWLSEKTGGMLDDMISGERFDEAVFLTLISAVYYRDRWLTEFNPALTQKGIFHGTEGDTEADFMHENESGSIYRGDTFTAIVRFFLGGERMWLILPNEGMTSDDVLADPGLKEMIYDPEVWERIDYGKVDIALPKFDVSSEIPLTEDLKALGADLIFDPEKADLSALLGDSSVPVSDVRQNARLKIDEYGCEAAAYTAVTALGGVLPEDQEQYEFIADRPFLYVQMGISDMPLFIGTVNTVN